MKKLHVLSQVDLNQATNPTMHGNQQLQDPTAG